MADPVTLAIIGTVTSVVGQFSQMQAQQAQYEAQENTARANATLAANQTQAELDKADRERRLRLGANIASQGASGISGGSSLDILDDNLTQETLNYLTIESEGNFRRDSYLASADNINSQAKSSKAGAILGMTSTAFSGFSNANNAASASNYSGRTVAGDFYKGNKINWNNGGSF